MRVVTARDYDQMSRKASYIVASRVILNPRCVLGLATGDTPKGLYRELVRLHQAGDVDFSGVTTFNLDEYVGLAPEHPNSYHRYMEEHFFRFVSIPPEQRHIPRGDAPDIAAECERYEEAVRRAGGVDLQILGLGRDGHIGFNEPDVKFEKGTHVVRLAPSTIEANARFFASAGEVPQSAISMGIKTIMSARRLLLLASGPEKAEAIRGAVLALPRPGDEHGLGGVLFGRLGNRDGRKGRAPHPGSRLTHLLTDYRRSLRNASMRAFTSSGFSCITKWYPFATSSYRRSAK